MHREGFDYSPMSAASFTAVCALIRTHPDPKLFERIFKSLAESIFESFLETIKDDQSREEFQAQFDKYVVAALKSIESD